MIKSDFIFIQQYYYYYYWRINKPGAYTKGTIRIGITKKMKWSVAVVKRVGAKDKNLYLRSGSFVPGNILRYD